MEAQLHILVAQTTNLMVFQPTRLLQIKEAFPQSLFMDIDNQSDPFLVHQVGLWIGTLSQITIWLDLDAQADAGALRSLIQQLLPFQSKIKWLVLGQHPVLSKMVQVFRFFHPIASVEEGLSIIKEQTL